MPHSVHVLRSQYALHMLCALIGGEQTKIASNFMIIYLNSLTKNIQTAAAYFIRGLIAR